MKCIRFVQRLKQPFRSKNWPLAVHSLWRRYVVFLRLCWLCFGPQTEPWTSLLPFSAFVRRSLDSKVNDRHHDIGEATADQGLISSSNVYIKAMALYQETMTIIGRTMHNLWLRAMSANFAVQLHHLRS